MHYRVIKCDLIVYTRLIVMTMADTQNTIIYSFIFFNEETVSPKMKSTNSQTLSQVFIDGFDIMVFKAKGRIFN